MWWDRSELLELYLSPGAIGRAATAVGAARWTQTSDLADSIRHLGSWLDDAAAPEVRRIRVWLSGSFAWPYLVPVASGARNRREVHALATAMARDATGIEGEVRLWLDRWHVDEPTLAVAIPADVWRMLHDMADARNAARRTMPRKQRLPAIKIASVRPWWNLPFDSLLTQSRGDANRVGWSLSDGDGVVHGVVDRGSVVEIGFDRPGLHDPTGSLLRRRLQVNWGAAAAGRHLHFERDAASPEMSALPIGAWRDMSGNLA